MNQEIDYVVGAERRLAELLPRGEIQPLMEAAVRSGLSRVRLLGDDGEPLAEACSQSAVQAPGLKRPLLLEGEPVGALEAEGPSDLAPGILELLFAVVDRMLTNNLKRMLTTEIHTQVVRQSYEELLESHRRLATSEQRYRNLARNLDLKVKQRTEELKLAHVRMLQQEKMASVGQLAAGVAHELNTPLGFVSSNLSSLGRYLDKLQAALLACRELELGEAQRLAFEKQWKEQKLDFVLEDIPDLIAQSLEGVGRAQKIVSDLKGFSHVDSASLVCLDLEQELEAALRVLAGRMPAQTRIHREFEALPRFTCNPALMSQVFLGLLSNAVDFCDKPLELRLGGRCLDGEIHLSIADNGPGIPAETLPRIFDPFFTTRDVGEGTGMGLTVVYDILRTLGGGVEVKSEPGQGACFLLRLPAGENHA